ANRGRLDFAEFEPQRPDDVIFLRLRLAVIKERRLTEMVKKAGATRTHFLRIDPFGVARKAAHVYAGLERTPAPEAVGVVTGLAPVDGLTHEPIALIIVQRSYGAVDGNLMKVRPAQSQQ